MAKLRRAAVGIGAVLGAALLGLATACHRDTPAEVAQPRVAAERSKPVTAPPHTAAPVSTSAVVRPSAGPPTSPGSYEFNDCHVHLTNYVQEGPGVQTFLNVMGQRVGRAVLFGIPLQQTWSFRVDGELAPIYYLNSDAPLYYYSFTDAYIAMTYRSLPPDQQARFDPMITGFNPADMYATDHIRRVLTTFPGVFSGIGEFTIHKEFVSGKIAGVTPSLSDPALARILDFAGEVGLLVLMHNDMDVPFAKPDTRPAYLDAMKKVLRSHPKTKIIWAHVGLGRVIHPVSQHAETIRKMVEDPDFANVYFDISWDEVGKYLMHDERTVRISSELFNRHPDRFLFGTDEVGPSDPKKYFYLFDEYGPLWRALTPEASEKLRKGNYERLFDEARKRVRAWEKANL
jgi:hypothetical protein